MEVESMADSQPAPEISPSEVGAMAAAAALMIAAAWALPAAATWTYHGGVPPLLAAIGGAARLVAHPAWSDPAPPYPTELRGHMPRGPGWWVGAIPGLGAVAAAAVGVWRRLDVLAARSTLGRRSYDVRGSRPRGWSRSRDVAHLAAHRRQPDRFTLGTLDG